MNTDLAVLGAAVQERDTSDLLEKCKWGCERGAPRGDGFGFGFCFLTASELDVNNTTGRRENLLPLFQFPVLFISTSLSCLQAEQKGVY